MRITVTKHAYDRAKKRLGWKASTVLKYGGEISFPDGSFVYRAEEGNEVFYVATRGFAKKGEGVERFPATKEGIYKAFQFLQ